jgi:hypothetical protein
MTRIPFDQLSKQYLEAFLEPLGEVQRNLEVPGEPKYIDVWFMPTSPNPAATEDLGRLSQMAITPCLLEPFRSPPSRQEVRTCLLKLLWMHEEQRRRREGEGKSLIDPEQPRLWILAATATQPVLDDFGGQLQPEWDRGCIFCQRHSILRSSSLIAYQ